MASIRCNSGGTWHTHTSSADVRACYLPPRPAPAAPAAFPTTSPPPGMYAKVGTRVVHTDADPTDDQIRYVHKLGGSTVAAKRMTRLECSNYIDTLKKKKEAPMSATSSHSDTIVPLKLLDFVPEGRYAVRADSTKPYQFIRLSRPKTGQYKGTTKIQTQHSDTLTIRMIVWPNRCAIYSSTIEHQLLLLIPGYREAAIAYGQELGQCCRCGKALTDENSRYYGIGDECDKSWPWIHQMVDEQRGPLVRA